MKTFHLIKKDGTAKAKVAITTDMYTSQGEALDTVLPMYFKEKNWLLVSKKEYELYKGI